MYHFLFKFISMFLCKTETVKNDSCTTASPRAGRTASSGGRQRLAQGPSQTRSYPGPTAGRALPALLCARMGRGRREGQGQPLLGPRPWPHALHLTTAGMK